MRSICKKHSLPPYGLNELVNENKSNLKIKSINMFIAF